MAIRNLTDLAAGLPPRGRLLGLDVGEKTIGLAVSDPDLRVASPIGTIRRTRIVQDMGELGRAMRDRHVAGLVLGLPINMDGSEGPRCQSVRQFAQNLIERPHLLGGEPEIAFWDERLSTAAVERMMVGWDMTRKRRGEIVDKLAAAYILQGALDFLAGGAAPSLSAENPGPGRWRPPDDDEDGDDGAAGTGGGGAGSDG